MVMVRRPARRRTFNPRTGGFLGIENKFFDSENTAASFSTAWILMNPSLTSKLTAMAQGDGPQERDGRKYSMTSIHIKGFINVPPVESNTAPAGDTIVRLVLVWDTQTNGAELTPADVMLTGVSNNVNSFRNLQFTSRFKVLWDKTFNLVVSRAGMNEGSANLFGAGIVRIPFKINKTFKTPISVTRSGSTANISNVTDNSISIIGVGITSTPTLTYEARIRFVG